MTGPAVALLVGIAGTTAIHLSKGMMRDGIVMMRRRRTRAVLLYYAVAVVLNHTNPLWVILSNRFAPAAYYTSMYAVGLVPLLLFARFRLGEEVTRKHAVGITVILIGSIVVGARGITAGDAKFAEVGYGAAPPLLLFGLLVPAVCLAILAASRGRRAAWRYVLFGLAAGGMSSLDAVFKGVAQRLALPAFLPSDPVAIALFATSFVLALGAFLVTNWAFASECGAAQLIAVYTPTYVVLPVVLNAVLSGQSAGLVTYFAVAAVAAGAYLAGSRSRRTSIDTLAARP